jgi:hypothetical protein
MNKTDNYELTYWSEGNFFILRYKEINLDLRKALCVDNVLTPKAWKILFLKGILPKEGLNMKIDKELFNLLYDTIQKE